MGQGTERLIFKDKDTEELFDRNNKRMDQIVRVLNTDRDTSQISAKELAELVIMKTELHGLIMQTTEILITGFVKGEIGVVIVLPAIDEEEVKGGVA